ncbi:MULTISPECIES: hypothetical protein [Streptomyces]
MTIRPPAASIVRICREPHWHRVQIVIPPAVRCRETVWNGVLSAQPQWGQ